MHPATVSLSLDRTGGDSLVSQLVEQLRERVLRGELAAGEPLLSSRALAQELGVSRSVVVRAYEQLNGEGYLEAMPGAATTVAQGIVAAPARVKPARARAAAPAQHSPEAPSGTAIDLRTGYPFVPSTPPEDWRRALAAAAREPLRSAAPPALGDPLLREQIALHARRSRGVNCGASDVIVTAGTVDALLLIALALGRNVLGRDARWGMEDPGYAEAAQILRLAGAEVHPVRVSEQAFQMSDLSASKFDPSTLDAMLVTPSHQFPLGGLMPAAERTALVTWASERNVLIVEDDYDSEFRHMGAALPAIAALDPGGTVVHIGSLNKSFSPSLRCGYVISTAGSEVWQALIQAKEVLGGSLPLAVQVATAKFFESGGFRRYVARARREYRHRRSLLIETLAAQGLAANLTGLDGGLHAILRMPAGRTGTEVAAALAARDVLVEAIAEFTQLDRADDAIAIGYGAEPVTRLTRGLEEVVRVVG